MAVIKSRTLFAEYAAPEAVAAYLKKAQDVAARANAEVRWLTALLAQKTGNQETGSQSAPGGDVR
jgi:hypothetical protein